MRMLLHMCCGPCSAFPLKQLRELGHDVTGYFYNPNIHPYKEFRKRLETAQDFAARSQLTMIVDDSYTLEEFLTQALQAENVQKSFTPGNTIIH
jgi:predicted adenine nucleotide alpha hydrolase (AANH) superfamily ATPase